MVNNSSQKHADTTTTTITTPTTISSTSPPIISSSSSQDHYSVHIPTPQLLLAKMNQNYIRTTKYTLLTFLPLNLYYQFNRIYNIYFLFAALSTLAKLSSLSPVTQILPLVFVLLAGAVKDGIEDFFRYKQDRAANMTKTRVLRNGILVEEVAKDLRMGEIIYFEKGEKFAVDCVVVSSNYEDGTAFVDTAELDGETNLKRRIAPMEFTHLQSKETVSQLEGVIECEHPNQNLLSFEGRIIVPNLPTIFKDTTPDMKSVVIADPTSTSPSSSSRTIPLSINNLLLRGAVLRNTEFCYAIVLYTGANTKIMKNLRKAKLKTSNLARALNRFTFYAFLLNMAMLISSIVLEINVFNYTVAQEKNAVAAGAKSNYAYYWYLDTPYSSNSLGYEIYYDFFAFFATYTYVIPISLFVSIEIARLCQGMFMIWDKKMTYYRTMPNNTIKKQRMRPNNTSLNEELGQVEFIFSDKTGTLTQNDMKSAFWWINRHSFHEMAHPGVLHASLCEGKHVGGSGGEGGGRTSSSPAKQQQDQDLDPLTKEYMALFMRAIVLAHGVIPAADEVSGKLIYESQSPDESALLNAIRDNHLVLQSRSKVEIAVSSQFQYSSVNQQQSGLLQGGGVGGVTMLAQPVEERYKLLACMEFTSDRKRMSVIVRTKDGSIHLYCKGADNIVLSRLSKDVTLNPPDLIADAVVALEKYSVVGLRTLVIAWKPLTEKEYEDFISEYEQAERAIQNRDDKLAAASEKVEVGLRFLGCTAIEDKLQDEVPETIDYLLKCDIRLWLLTGDKQETAINIGMSSKLITPEMNVHVLQGKTIPELSDQLRRLKDKFESDARIPSKSDTLSALVVNGETLAQLFSASEDVQKEFLWLGTRCHSVICCRVTPLQKALVVNLVKTNVKCITLAIGDGANDVSMIQAANIGVGIMGKEGTQAVRASDYAFGEFRFLKRLICVHGRYSYMRLALIIMYSFYKNITLIGVMWWFGFQCLWSGQLVYEEIFMTAYNIVFTSLPPLVMAIFDRDVNDYIIDKYPQSYREVKRGMYWNWWTVAGWIGSALWQTTAIFGSVWFINRDGNLSQNGKTTGYWVQTSLYGTPLLLTVTLKYALATKTFVWVTAATIAISLILNMIGLFILEKFGYSEVGNGVIDHVLPVYYLTCLLVPIMCNLPDLIFMYVKRQNWPHDADILCEEQSQFPEKRDRSSISPDMEITHVHYNNNNN